MRVKEGYRAPQPPEKTPFYRDWRKLGDFAQSMGTALLVNLFVIVCLSLFAVRSSIRREVPEVVVRVSPSETQTNTEASSSSSSARKKQQKSSEVEEVKKTVQDAFRAHALSEFSLPSIGMPSAGDNFSAGAAEFGIGKALGKQGLMTGVGPGELGTIFDGKGLGDGSEMILYLDSSRSMIKHSRQVENLVNNLFPNAKIYRVKGCAIEEDSGFVRALESNWSLRGKVFFVCDLQDPVTYEGLQKLRSVLLDHETTRELHIISFQNQPVRELKSIIDESWGSISLVLYAPPK